MICPAAPSSASNVKVSGANWLDRLRSSRGFPPADTLDLNQFISGQGSPSTVVEPRRLASLHAVDEEEEEEEEGEGEDENVNDILCELFAMGGGGRRRKGRGRVETSNCSGNWRKSSRKQQNPRFWDATASSKKSSNGGCSDDLSKRKDKKGLNRNNNKLASSGDNSLNQHRKLRDSKDPGELGQDVEEKEEDLKGYSKSEVTVIDSSIQGWKIELLVFRKRKSKSKSVWKVREKTNKSRSLVNPRRKRKFSKPDSSDNDDDYENGDRDQKREKKRKKKMFLGVSDSSPSNLFKNGNGKEVAVVPLINEEQVRDEKLNHILKGTGYLCGEASIKSSHWKSKSEASSVILVKPLSTFDKPGSRKPGNSSVNGGQILL
ncbi:hypothetical protein V2J09_011255 [Rumex salicifolius]